MMKRMHALLGRGASLLRPMVVAVAVAAISGASVSAAHAATSAAIVVDAKTGRVLYSSNPDARAYPASLTKMMTLYLLFEALDAGKVSLTSRIPISKHAAAQPPSKLGLKPGQSIAVKDAILALVTRSANDIAAAIGEYLAGSESAFAGKMTAKARAIGMRNTTFKNASGLPDSAQVTTARDMALLGRALQQRFPTYFAYFKTPSFTYAGRKIANHNRLLGRVDGVDGIKTGYTRASGFNLVTSVNQGNRKLVAVVLGGTSGKSRDDRMASLVKTYVAKASTGPMVAKLNIPDGQALAPVAVAMADADDEPEAEVAKPAAPAKAEPPVLAFAGVLPTPRPRANIAVAALTVPADTDEDAAEAETADAGPEVEAVAQTEDESIQTASIGVATAFIAKANAEALIASAHADEADAEGDIGGDEIVPAAATVAPKAESDVAGWKIQLAATPTQDGARAVLERARGRAGAVLSEAVPYTEEVVRNSTTLYRARFAGFTSKDAARAACAYLSKRDFSCLALAD